MSQRLRIGTAGWSIPAPVRQDFPSTGTLLEKYTKRFDAVEINSSFYRQHKQATYKKWASLVPNDFLFSVKVPHIITHDLKLRDIAEPLDQFAGQVSGLGSKLGCVLVQLPPGLSFDHGDASSAFRLLRATFSCAILCEPRHHSWFSDNAEEMFYRNRVSRVAADPALCAEAERPGGDSSAYYYPLHGSPDMYNSNYGLRSIEAYAQSIAQLQKNAPVWCIFDNTAKGHAISNAMKMQKLLAR